MAPVPLLSARGLAKSFGGRLVLDGLDLEHHDGTVVAVSHDRCFLDRIVLVADGRAHVRGRDLARV